MAGRFPLLVDEHVPRVSPSSVCCVGLRATAVVWPLARRLRRSSEWPGKTIPLPTATDSS